MSEDTNMTKKIIEFVDQNFVDGNDATQARNFKNLISFMDENGITYYLEADEYEELLENKKVSKMVSSLLKCKDNGVYLEHALFYSLAIIYANSHGIKLDINSEVLSMSDEAIESLKHSEALDTIYPLDESRETYSVEESIESNIPAQGDKDYVESDLLKAYLKDLRYEPYTDEQEKEIFKRYAEGEKDLKEDIMKHNLRLVVSIAKKYSGLGVELIDLIQEGNIGLNTAVDRYDYKTGNKFSTYATWWIRQSVVRSISNDSRTIRIPVHLTDVMSKINTFLRKYRQEHSEEFPSNETIAAAINEDPEKVKKVLGLQKVVSLNQKVIRDGDSEAELGDFIEDPNVDEFEASCYYSEFNSAVFDSNILSERETIVIQYRYGFIDGKRYTLDEIGKMFNVTRERIRQIEAKALRKLRRNKRIQQFGDEENSNSYYLRLMRNQKQALI